MSVPAGLLAVSGNPITGAGTLALTLTTATQNKVFASPNGSTGAGAYRALVAGDLPLPGASSLGGVFSKAAISHNFLTAIVAADGSVTSAQPAFTDISGTAAAGQLPLPGAASLGGVFSKAAVSHNFLTAIVAADGSVTSAQPAFTDISGNINVSQMNSGTNADSSHYWRGDSTWATVSSGGVTGPGSSTSTAIARWNGTGGTAIQDSAVLVSASSSALITIQGNDLTSSTNADGFFLRGGNVSGGGTGNGGAIFISGGYSAGGSGLPVYIGGGNQTLGADTDTTKYWIFQNTLRAPSAASSPAYSFQASTNSGMHWSGSEIFIYQGGTAVFAADSDAVYLDSSDLSILAGPGSIATSGTRGFFYSSTVAGTPTGVPIFHGATGWAACVIDTTGGKLWSYYGGAWHFVALT
jgi:hypothetical protein